MALPSLTWPASLPAPLLDGYQETEPDLVLRTEMEVGPAKVRRRAEKGVWRVAFELHLTAAQKGALRDFYRGSAGGGAVPFAWTDVETGTGYAARFVGPPVFRQLGVRYRAQIELEILPQ
jgi:hypothetical protein